MLNPQAAKPPVFVVGMNGSGTTLMLDCLNAHSEIYGFRRETLVIPHVLSAAPSSSELVDDDTFRKLWDEFRGLSSFRWVNGGEEPALPKNWREFPRTPAAVIDGVFRTMAAREGKERWCEKTPMHALHISSLNRAFPGAKFIHMIRDGRACSASFHRRWGYVPDRTIYRWKNLIRSARKQAEQTGAAYLEVRYEDFVADPEKKMRTVSDFLGVPYQEATLASSRERFHTGTDGTEIVSRSESWKTYFSILTLRRLERIGGAVLSECGYDVADSSADHNPARAAVALWEGWDYMRMGARVVWRELRTPRAEKWDDLSSRFVNAIRQRRTNRKGR